MQEKATHAEGQNGEAPLEMENNGNHAKPRRKAASPSEYPDSLSYIRQRHGRTDLRPMPSDDPEGIRRVCYLTKDVLIKV